MPTLKKLKEDRLSITSKLLKKDEDFSPISPELIKDLRDRTLLENSALKLSISDYKLMCSKNIVLNMMAKALNKPKDKLKKFCKYLSVFEENISKSPKSIAYKINGPITNLPKEIRSTILDKFAEILPTKYVLLDWIDKDKLNWDRLSANPNAIDLLEENKDKINWKLLSKNPNAIDLLDERIKYENSLTEEQYNNLEFHETLNWWLLSRNPNAIKLLEKNKDEIDWESLSRNPNAIKLLEKNKDKIDWESLSANPNAIDLLKERIKYENSLTDAQFSRLKDYQKINWWLLSRNPNAIDLLKANPNEINWESLSQNPNAIELLKRNKNKIRWNFLSTNPNAIDLLKQKIEYENNLTKTQYNNLKYFDKINWVELSANPNAIDLLENNPNEIDWVFLASNPNAINLLKNNNIDMNYQYWNELSANPAIFKAV